MGNYHQTETSERDRVDAGSETEAAALYCERKAEAVLAQLHPERIQPDTRNLPIEVDLERGRFAARQLRLIAEELRAAFHQENSA